MPVMPGLTVLEKAELTRQAIARQTSYEEQLIHAWNQIVYTHIKMKAETGQDPGTEFEDWLNRMIEVCRREIAYLKTLLPCVALYNLLGEAGYVVYTGLYAVFEDTKLERNPYPGRPSFVIPLMTPEPFTWAEAAEPPMTDARVRRAEVVFETWGMRPHGPWFRLAYCRETNTVYWEPG